MFRTDRQTYIQSSDFISIQQDRHKFYFACSHGISNTNFSVICHRKNRYASLHVQGPSYERVCAIRREHLMPNFLTYYKKPLLLHEGHMQWLWDHQGRRYLDLFAGIVTISVGHCHPSVSHTKADDRRAIYPT